ncbi:Methyltransferase domain protein [Acididesulfobacillus acetoxydans]|uniref:Methyltransferase domain protein n=1 Tax=Acididesulfobacillus acetoxydans TaxID=1561005 RepID=A0A8S0WLH5_9FIRM|nr:Methyltransferase domain protein [Acididesulfobacillus acetoxydans]CEJ05990.1 Methyltransferase domain protein [Acididesulfobacillus acetoxydans]
MEPGMLALLGRAISLMENLGFLWVVQTGFELDLWRELEERRSLEDLAALHPTWDKVLLDHWLEQAFCQELLTKDNLSYRVSKLGRAVQTYRSQGLEAMFQEFVHHWNPGFAKLPQLLSRQGKKLNFDPKMEEELISQASLASEPFVWPFLKHKCQKSKWQRVLDIGCGEGLYLNKLLESCPSLRGVGIELNPVVADRARKHTRSWGSRLEIVCEDALHAGEELGTFDACLLNNNIYFFSPEERKELLNNLKRLLKPAGEIGILSALRQNEPQFRRVFPTQVSRNLMSFFIACHEGFEGLPNEDEIRELLLATGCTNIEVTPLPFLVSHYFFARMPN